MPCPLKEVSIHHPVEFLIIPRFMAQLSQRLYPYSILFVL